MEQNKENNMLSREHSEHSHTHSTSGSDRKHSRSGSGGITPSNVERDNLVGKETPFYVTEAYKAIRTNLMFMLTKQGCKKLLFTSSEPGEGKTTTVMNLAITTAQTGAKVLLIDADLRRPRIHRYFEVSLRDGASNVLGGMAEIDEVIKHTSFDNLDVITAGQIPPNPSELLVSPNMKKFLSDLSELYDYIFIDTPPVDLVTDAAVISKYCDGVVIVVRQDVTNTILIDRTLEALEFVNANIVGFILNDVKARQQSYKYRYRYRYRYKYRYRSKYKYGYSGYGYGYGYGDRLNTK